MRDGARIGVMIPALNEERAIGRVLDAIPEWVDRRVVVDNACTDATAEVARARGADVVNEPERGYGAACLAGIAALEACADPPHIVVFLDGDFSDSPGEMDQLVDPILRREADMVIGSRVARDCQPGALTPQARFGNWLSCALMRMLWGVRYTDLGPFRAIRLATLKALEMADRDFGWTVEMQVKAAKRGFRYGEVPVSYRKRIGTSKISGTVKGVFAAGTKILYTIFREALSGGRSTPCRERLAVFTRYPVPGETKTRLIPALGAEGAADVQRAMTEHTVVTARAFREGRGVDVDIRYDNSDDAGMCEWLGTGLAYRPQATGDLGDRMWDAVHAGFLDGMDRVVVIGIDAPGVTEDTLAAAFDAMNGHDLVIGPATDGGYYLIGLSGPAPALFRGVEWGTEKVLAQTVEIASRAGLRVAQLDELSDVDRPEDLGVWEEAKAKSVNMDEED
ncbi:MAG: DUF2064 domain-containing protein [bacterium]|nr:DUF2064 domain-containing protein [bacterium]